MARMSTRRKLAIAAWGSPREGNIYGKLTLDAEKVLAYLDHVRQATGEKVTMTHFVGRAVADVLANAPGLNGRILFGSYVKHTTVDISYLVTLEGGSDLAKAKVVRANEKTVADIAKELRGLAERLRKGKDPAFQKSKGTLRLMPTWLLRPLIALTGWLTGALGISMPALGLEAFPFGACIITSLGMFGLDEAYVPPTPFARVPLYVLVGAIAERAVVEAGNVVPRTQVTVTATLDHRFIDGHEAALLATRIKQSFAEPWRLDGLERSPLSAA
jgi:pyruvate/2-oxoglutarate dehydrogenase complex dihydrolipoamide acyltransferase (E2) component